MHDKMHPAAPANFLAQLRTEVISPPNAAPSMVFCFFGVLFVGTKSFFYLLGTEFFTIGPFEKKKKMSVIFLRFR